MKNKILELITINNRIIQRRCSESYIKKHSPEIYDYLCNVHSDRPFNERIKLIITDNDGLCIVCGKPTKIMGNGKFPKTCSPQCGVKLRKLPTPPHKVVIPKNELEYLYNVAKLQPRIIGELYDCSNVTVTRNMRDYGMKQRSHSEQVRLYNPCTPSWNYSGYDRSLLDIDRLIEENKTKTLGQIAREIGCSNSTVHQTFKKYNVKCNDHSVSYPEIIIQNHLIDNNIDFIVNDNNVVGNKLELDVLIKKYNLAIEVNGVYWHSLKFRNDKLYHVNKSKQCNDKNIRLLHFWDVDILSKTNIVLSIINKNIGLCANINKNKCAIKEITLDTIKIFMNKNHIKGFKNCDYGLGLFYKRRLVAVASFKKHDNYLELVRVTCKNNIIIDDYISCFCNNVNKNIMYSFDIMNESLGDYTNNGFTIHHYTRPSLVYSSNTKIVSKNSSNVEHEMYNCGKLILIKKPTK